MMFRSHWALALLFLLLVSRSHAQDRQQELRDFNEERVRISRNGMLVLGGWAVANMGGSAVGWATARGEAKYFHQMNVVWNVANLSIALPGYLGSREVPEMGPLASLEAQKGHEKIFLFNGGLDVGYIMGGLYLRELSRRYPKHENRLMGYGNSLVVQGGFLLGFDAVMYLLHRSNAQKKLQPVLDRVEIGATGLRIIFPLPGQHVRSPGAALAFY